jgi:hypothetical protein
MAGQNDETPQTQRQEEEEEEEEEDTASFREARGPKISGNWMVLVVKSPT